MSVLRYILRLPARNLLHVSKLSVLKRPMSLIVSNKLKKMKSVQATMQCQDDVPIYLKKGTPDKIIFGAHCFIMFVGGVELIRFVWKGAQKK